MEIAFEHNLRSIAFPAISTGVYGYPLSEAAPLALQAVIDCVKQHDGIMMLVRFVLYDRTAFLAFSSALDTLVGKKEDLRLI
jgi:O-acetyl-ADP-ribose deacetylase (regulator of RNase III)